MAKTDHADTCIWMWRIVKRWEKLASALATCLTYATGRLWGVDLGRGCHFYGRTLFSRALGSSITIGDDCTFRSAVWSNKVGLNRPCMISTLNPEAEVIIGNGVGMSGTVIGAAKSIKIGDNVLCGGNVTITDTDWHGIQPNQRRTPGLAGAVIIEDNVWLGLNVTVMKGVTIGRNSVIGAGSIVNRSIPPDVIAGGQPARVLKKLDVL